MILMAIIGLCILRYTVPVAAQGVNASHVTMFRASLYERLAWPFELKIVKQLAILNSHQTLYLTKASQAKASIRLTFVK